MALAYVDWYQKERVADGQAELGTLKPTVDPRCPKCGRTWSETPRAPWVVEYSSGKPVKQHVRCPEKRSRRPKPSASFGWRRG